MRLAKTRAYDEIVGTTKDAGDLIRERPAATTGLQSRVRDRQPAVRARQTVVCVSHTVAHVCLVFVCYVQPTSCQ
jgi:hypothetical protein